MDIGFADFYKIMGGGEINNRAKKSFCLIFSLKNQQCY